MEQSNWRLGMYPDLQNEFTYPSLDDDMSFHQPPASNTLQKKRSHPVSNYIGYGQQQNQQFQSPFPQEGMGSDLSNYSTPYHPHATQGMTISAGIVPSGSPSRYNISQPLPGMSLDDDFPSSVSPQEIFRQPSAKKQKVNEYRNSCGSPSAQPVTPPRRVTRGSKVDYTGYFSSPSTNPLLSSPATSVEHNANPSKDPEVGLQPFAYASQPYDHQYHDKQAQYIDQPAYQYSMLDSNLPLPEDSALDPVFVPKARARGFAAKKPAKKTGKKTASAPKVRNFLKTTAQDLTPKKQANINNWLSSPKEAHSDAPSPQNPSIMKAPAIVGDGQLTIEEFEDEIDEAVYQEDGSVKVNGKAVPIKFVHKANPVVDQQIVQSNKPEPVGWVKYWANNRQALCSAVKWFKAVQGGNYHNDHKTYGMLVSKEAGFRDKFDHEIIITTTGGGRKIDKSTKKMTQQSDQTSSPTAKYLRNSMDMNIHVGIVATRENPISPSKLPHPFNVLGWFHVTDVWVEYRNGFQTWVAKFEKIDLTQPSWWAPKGVSLPQGSYENTCPGATCINCHTTSKTTFEIGWICMNNKCRAFFVHHLMVDHNSLEYSKEFLQERTPFQGTVPSENSLVPSLPTEENTMDKDVWGTEEVYKNSIVCPLCGCCSRRLNWTFWNCENDDCEFTHQFRQKLIPAQLAISDASSARAPEFCHAMVQKIGPELFGLYRFTSYILPLPNGEGPAFISIGKSNGLINQQRDGPNDLFTQMQTGNFNLKRKGARNAGKTIEMATNHWATNWGAPYKYGVAMDSTGFNEAPEVVIKAVKRLTWASEQALTGSGTIQELTNVRSQFVPFNECLTVGYFETSEMGWHDDGEKTLAPTVTSLSLGSPATMQWRPKMRSPMVFPKDRNSVEEEEVVEVEGEGRKTRTKPAVLSVKLEHGDIMVMHGSAIQKHYEHTVVSLGKLRFGMTCRHVIPELVDPKNKKIQEMARAAGQLPEGHEKFDYDGDINATPDEMTEESEKKARHHISHLNSMVKTGMIDKAQMDAFYNTLMR